MNEKVNHEGACALAKSLQDGKSTIAPAELMNLARSYLELREILESMQDREGLCSDGKAWLSTENHLCVSVDGGFCVPVSEKIRHPDVLRLLWTKAGR